MATPPLPIDEQERLENLRTFAILDTPPEDEFDELVRLAGQICEAPSALISLVDKERQWFKARVGLEAAEMRRCDSFCAYAILEPGLLEIADARLDERFAQNPIVTEKDGFRFYAGIPLISPEGFALGALCVLDRRVRELSESQKAQMASLGRIVAGRLSLRREALRREEALRAGRALEDELERRVQARTLQLQRANEELVCEIEVRKQIEEELYSAKQMKRLVLDHVPQYVFWKNTDSIFLGCNEAFAKAIGFKRPEEVVGLSDFDLSVRDCALRFRADDREVMTSLAPKLRYREQLQRPNGPVRWLETSKVPFTDPEGNVLGLIGTYEDITERMRIEDELLAAKEAAEASDRSKTAFLTNISHELRTPMNGVLATAEFLLCAENLSPEQEQCLSIIHESAQSLMVILNDVLDSAKIGAGRMRLEKLEFDLQRNVRSALGIFEAEARRKELYLRWRVQAGVPKTIESDPHRLRQVIVNLVGNALKFTHRGGIEVVVRAACPGEQAERVYFAVRDTGIGIAADKLGQIFEPFSQADNSLTRRYGGTGLGLSICSELVAMMGGEIGVSSEPGVGSEFRFSITAGG